MEIQYLSHAEAALFGEMIHSESELAELFGKLVLLLDADTDYDTIMISFEDEDVMRVSVEDSPYLIVLDERDQRVYLQQDHEDVYDDEFNEDGIESIVDMIASRILTQEQYAG